MSDTLIKQVVEGTVTGTEGAYPYFDQVGKIVSGSVGGSLTIYTVSHGPGFGLVLIVLNAFNDAGQVITFPYAFAQAPGTAVNTTTIGGPTIIAASVNFGATGGAKSGYLCLIGNTA
jgi:hypothetical protein